MLKALGRQEENIIEIGNTYYQLGFSDPKLTIPSLKPMVYIGQNIFGNETEETFYFQDTVSVIVFGLLPHTTETSECKISSCSKQELKEGMYTLEEAIIKLQDVELRAKSLGYPKLKKAKGTWS